MDSRLAPEHLIQRDGKDFVLYAGLLSLAHADGLKSIEITVLQIPSADNGMSAVVAAKVTTSKGTFSEIGDASPSNVGRFIVPHLLRMASTRAKARALRDAVNVGVVALEELDEDGIEEATAKKPQQAQQTPQQRAGAALEARQAAGASSSSDTVDGISPPQLRAIYAIGRNELQWSDEQIDAMCQQRYGGRTPGHLSKREASELIDRMKNNPASLTVGAP